MFCPSKFSLQSKKLLFLNLCFISLFFHGLCESVTETSSESSLDMSDLETRFLLKKAALESKMAAVKAKEEMKTQALFTKTIKDENGTYLMDFSYPHKNDENMNPAEFQHPADYVFSFAINHSLSINLRYELYHEICNKLDELCGNRTRGIVSTLPISSSNGILGIITILDGEEVIDIAYDFVQQHKNDLPDVKNSILRIYEALCPPPLSQVSSETSSPLIGCHRNRPLLYHRPKGWAGLPEDLNIYEGDEAVDVIYDLVVNQYKFETEAYKRITDRICIPSLLYHKFPKVKIETKELKMKYKYFKCHRHRIIKQNLPIGGGGGSTLGHVEVWDEEEPIDAVYRFLFMNKLDQIAKNQIFNVICSNRANLNLIPCERDIALLLNIDLTLFLTSYIENEKQKYLQNEITLQKNKNNKIMKEDEDNDDDDEEDDDEEELNMRNRLDLNDRTRYNDNDNILKMNNDILSNDLKQLTSSSLSMLTIWEKEEPSDMIYKWCEKNNLSELIRTVLIDKVCNNYFNRELSELIYQGLPIHCKRKQPIVMSIPLSDEKGRSLGLFTLLAGEELADAARAFALRNQVGANFRASLMHSLCGQNSGHNITCSRTRALAVKKAVTYHPGYQGPTHPDSPNAYETELEVWEDEEPADAVYRFSLMINKQARRRYDLLLKKDKQSTSTILSRDEMPLSFRQGLIFNLCNDLELALVCSRPVPALFNLKLTNEKADVIGELAVLEGQRPADALHGFMKESKLAQVFKHPNLRRRLFHRLCSAARDEGRPLDCSENIPRIQAAEVELTYSGIKSHLGYFFPDGQYIDPLYPQALDGCVPIPQGLDPLGEEDEKLIARFAYDQSIVDHQSRRWLKGFGPIRIMENNDKDINLTHQELDSPHKEEEEFGELLPTEARTHCLAPTRRAVMFFCDRLMPYPNNCMHDVHTALLGSLMRGDESRWVKAGPVGIDYYQMLRCPNDAPLAEVKTRMASVGHEVGVLVRNTSKTVNYISNLTYEGMSSFNEAEQSLLQAQASLKAVSDLLRSANHTISVAKHYLTSSYHSQLGFVSSLSSVHTLFESFRHRLLNICNQTIIQRNCTFIEKKVLLSSIETNQDKKLALIYTLEKEMKEKQKKEKEKKEEKEEEQNHSQDKNNNKLGKITKNNPSSKVTMNLEEIKKRRNEMLGKKFTSSSSSSSPASSSSSSSSPSSSSTLTSDDDIDDDDVEETTNEKLSRYALNIWELEMSQKVQTLKNRKQIEVEVDQRMLKYAKKATSPSRSHNNDDDEDDGKDENDTLVSQVVWRVCLPQTNLNQSPSSLSPSFNVRNSSSEMNILLNIDSQNNVDVKANNNDNDENNDENHNFLNANQIAKSSFEQDYEKAVEGCQLLNSNSTWICPEAAQRLNSLLPRYPIEESLNITKNILKTWEESLNLTKASLKNIQLLFKTSNNLLLQVKTGKVISYAALTSSMKNFKIANETSLMIKDDMEKSKHRSFAMERSHFDLIQDKNREFYDKPCRPVFGACCARDQADGGMNIICG